MTRGSGYRPTGGAGGWPALLADRGDIEAVRGGVLLVAADRAGRDLDRRVEEEPVARRVLGDLPGDLLQQFGLLVGGGGGFGLLHPLLDLRVVVLPVEVRVAVPDQVTLVDVGHDRGLEVVVLVDLVGPGGVVDRVQGDVDAGLGELALQPLRHDVDRVGRHVVHGERDPVRVSGLGQRLLGRVQVVVVDAGQVLVPGVGRRDHRAEDLAAVGPDRVQQRLAVGRLADRLAYVDVVERGHRVVEVEQFLGGRGALDDGELGPVLELGEHVRGRHLGHQVELAGEQGVVLGGGVLEEAVHHLLVLRRVAPVLVVADQVDRVALLPRRRACTARCRPRSSPGYRRRAWSPRLRWRSGRTGTTATAG